MAFLAAENENQQLKDLPVADFGGVPERFLLSVRTNPITENFVAWLLVDMKFCYVGTSRAFTILFNCYVNISRTFRNSFICELLKYLAYF